MIVFKPLRKEDLPLLHSWLNQAHMRKFYQQQPIAMEEVIEKYTGRIEGTVPIYCHLACFENRPIGKIQCYKNADYREYAQEIGVTDGVSIDLFIGEPSFLGKGLGVQMLQSYLLDVAFKIFKDESHCYICHETENVRAIGCSEKAGFSFMREVVEEGKPSRLFRYSRT